MADMAVAELFSFGVLLTWVAVFSLTVPFLFMAARGGRGFAQTIVLLAVWGLIIAWANWYSTHTAPRAPRSTEFWIAVYASRAASLGMALTLAFRVWDVMLRRRA